MSISINKPWGYKKILVETPNYTVARLFINKKERLSLQEHPEKIETLIVEKSHCLITVGEITRRCSKGDCVHITSGTRHRIEAGKRDCIVLEVATKPGDEVVRIEDDYGRVPE